MPSGTDSLSSCHNPISQIFEIVQSQNNSKGKINITGLDLKFNID